MVVLIAVAFVVVDLELTPQAVALPSVVMRSEVGEEASALHVKHCAQHAAQVNAVIGAASVLDGGQNCNHRCPDHEPFHLDREDIEDDDALREDKGVGDKYSEDRSGCADRGSGAQRIQKRLKERSADSADEEELSEGFFPPEPFQLRAKHPEAEHVEDDVEKSAVQKYVGHRLPQVKLVCDLIWNESEFAGEGRPTGNAIDHLHDEYGAADDDQTFDRWADAAWANRSE